MEIKIKICKLCYKLIQDICKNNRENEIYTFPMLSKFKIHTKYFSEAVDCVITIIGSNEEILNKMSEGIDPTTIPEDIKTISNMEKDGISRIDLFNV